MKFRELCIVFFYAKEYIIFKGCRDHGSHQQIQTTTRTKWAKQTRTTISRQSTNDKTTEGATTNLRQGRTTRPKDHDYWNKLCRCNSSRTKLKNVSTIWISLIRCKIRHQVMFCYFYLLISLVCANEHSVLCC